VRKSTDKRRKPKASGGASRNLCLDSAKKIEVLDLHQHQRNLEIFLFAVLLAFGIYQSVLYFGHTIVPNSDFPAFNRLGHELWSLRPPTAYKWAPVVGLLQVPLGWLVGGRYPDLTGGWLLNAILHPFNLILLWLIGKKVVGNSAALWFAIVAILNPWVIYLLTEPIAETPLLFFMLLTYYLIFKRSSWAYLFASITTMVRYEGAALILAAFVMDMIYSATRRQRIRAFAYSAAATVPLAVWMLGTFLNWQPGQDHYLNILKPDYTKSFGASLEDRTGVVRHMRLLWQVGFRPLLVPYPGAGKDAVGTLWGLSKVIAMVGFFFGSAYGLIKRRWEVLALLLFFVPYFLLHARYPYPIPRFHATIFWIALLLCLLGLQGLWRLINDDGRVPRSIVVILQAVVAITASIWLVPLVAYLPKLSPISPKSVSVPYVAMAVAAVIFAGRILIYKFYKSGYLVRELAVFVLLCTVIVSNQFFLVSYVGDGHKDEEFKLLADWYVAHAKPGEKMACYMNVVEIFAPEQAANFVGFPKADSPEELVKACCERDITYVIWASREGLSSDHTGYYQLGLDKNIAFLRNPRSIGPYEFITQLGSKRGYVNIFRLHRPQEGMNQEPPDSRGP
jgi:hypothetical protein